MILEAKTQLLGEFEERFREQISSMIQNVNDVTSEMSPQDAFKAQQALSKAEAKLLKIQERILGGQYEDALNDLENATETLSEDFDDMEDPGTAQMLKTMNKLEAKIQKMEQKATKKAAKGLGTSDEDALLRGNKDHTKNDFKENKGKGNSGNNGKPDKGKGKPDKEKKDKD